MLFGLFLWLRVSEHIALTHLLLVLLADNQPNVTFVDDVQFIQSLIGEFTTAVHQCLMLGGYAQLAGHCLVDTVHFIGWLELQYMREGASSL